MSALVLCLSGGRTRGVLGTVQCSLPPPHPPPYRDFCFSMKCSSCWEMGKKDEAGSPTVSYKHNIQTM